jgi:peptide-methionine (S)-S-oxide reductase
LGRVTVLPSSTRTNSRRRWPLATIAEIEASGLWPGPVVTEINPEERFWQAEPEHQDYLQRRPSGYSCHFIRPNWRLPSAPAFQNPRTAEGPKN